jgi:hypothetical protein
MDHLIQIAYLLPTYDPRDVIRVVWSVYSLSYFGIATGIFMVKFLDGEFIMPMFQYCHRVTFLMLVYSGVYTLIHVLDSIFSHKENTDILWKIHSELKKGRKQNVKTI